MPKTIRRRQLSSIVALCFLAVFAAIAKAGTPIASKGCGGTPPLAPGESAARTIQVGDLEREYRLHLPAGFDPSVPAPLVLAIHGYTTTAERLEKEYTSFSQHADEHGYVVVYPQATSFEVAGNLITSWNDLACNASPGPEGSTCTDEAVDYPTPPECGEPRECDWCSCYSARPIRGHSSGGGHDRQGLQLCAGTLTEDLDDQHLCHSRHVGTVRRDAGERRIHVHTDLAGHGCVGS
jgi:hypothetical protein